MEGDGLEERDQAEGFEVLELIGRGGAGKVYRAVQRSSGDTVALKVLGEGILAGEEARQRFQQEASLARRLDHPNIVKILAVSSVEEPEPWLALEFVEGRSLSDVLRRGLPAPRIVAEWLRQISAAVEHAHEYGVLHRDLKPSNVLIDNDGRARLTDFGVARLIETSQVEMTRTGQVLGTPAYMAPEQASGRRGAAGASADVYGLGAVLYHALTGRAPFAADSVAAILHQVVHADPVPLRRLNASLPRDLETLCLRCLEKEPARRPPSALTLAAELERFLAGRPILSQPPTVAERTGRWARRHVRESVLIAALVLSLGVGAAALVVQWRATVAARKVAEVQAIRAELDNYATSMREAAAAIYEGRLAEADELLDQWIPKEGRRDYRGMEWFFLHQAAVSPSVASFTPYHEAAITGIAFLPDRKRFLTLCQGGPPRLWSLPDRKLLQTLEGVGTGHESVEVTPDGRWVLLADSPSRRIRRLDATTFRQVADYPGRDFALSGDGRSLVTTMVDPWNLQGGGKVEAFDLETGGSLGVLSDSGRRVAFQPVGSLLAVAQAGHGIYLIDSHTWKTVGTLLDTSRHIHDLSFSPDGRTLFGCDWGGTVWSWDVASHQRRVLQARHFRTSQALAAPGGNAVFLASTDHLIHVVDTVTGQETARLGGHADEVWTLAMTPDGCQLLSGGKDGRLMLWDAAPSTDDLPSFAAPVEPGQPLYFPDRGKVIMRSYQSPDEIVDLTTLKRYPLDEGGYTAAVTTMGDLVQVHQDQHLLTFHSNENGHEIRRTDLKSQISGEIVSYTSSVNGRWLGIFSKPATGSGMVTLWDLAEDRPVSKVLCDPSPSRCRAVSNDGRWLLNGIGSALSLYNLSRPGDAPATFRHAFYEFTGGAFSPDGRRVAVGNHDAAVRVFRTEGLQLEYEFHGHYFDTAGVGFSPDGLTLVSLGSREGVRFWRLDSGHQAGFISVPESQHLFALAPDGSSLLVEKLEGFDLLRTRK